MRRNKGITIIALVITIIVLLILAGVSIATLFGSNGIISQANRAKLATEEANAKEKLEIEVLGCYETNGNLSLKKLKENIPNIGTVKNPETENFPLEVDVDGYPFKITWIGEVSSLGTSGTGGTGGSEESGGDEGENDTVTKADYDRLDEKVNQLAETLNSLNKQIADSNSEVDKMTEQVSTLNSELSNATTWNIVEVADVTMPTEAWHNVKFNVPEIKNAKRLALYDKIARGMGF